MNEFDKETKQWRDGLAETAALTDDSLKREKKNPFLQLMKFVNTCWPNEARGVSPQTGKSVMEVDSIKNEVRSDLTAWYKNLPPEAVRRMSEKDRKAPPRGEGKTMSIHVLCNTPPSDRPREDIPPVVRDFVNSLQTKRPQVSEESAKVTVSHATVTESGKDDIGRSRFTVQFVWH